MEKRKCRLRPETVLFTKRHLRRASGLMSGARAGFPVAHSGRDVQSGGLGGRLFGHGEWCRQVGSCWRGVALSARCTEALGQCPSYVAWQGLVPGFPAPMVVLAPEQQGSVGRGKGRGPRALHAAAWRRCAAGAIPRADSLPFLPPTRSPGTWPVRSPPWARGRVQALPTKGQLHNMPAVCNRYCSGGAAQVLGCWGPSSPEGDPNLFMISMWEAGG